MDDPIDFLPFHDDRVGQESFQRSSTPTQATVSRFEQPLSNEEAWARMGSQIVNDDDQNDFDSYFLRETTSFHDDQVSQAEGSYPPFLYEEPDSDKRNLAEDGEPVSYPVGEHSDAFAPLNKPDLFDAGLNSSFGTADPGVSTDSEDDHAMEPSDEISKVARNEGRAKILKNRKQRQLGNVVVQYDTYAELEGFLSSTKALPDLPEKTLSLETICREYPNHLVGEHLDAFIQYKWTGLDIYSRLKPKVIKAFRKAGVMSSEHKNRANFLTKRLDKRMNFHTRETMKALIEAPVKLRPCLNNGKEHYGRSKLRDKYTNNLAQGIRTMPSRQYNGMSARKRAEATAAGAEKVEADGADNDNKSERESEPRDRLRDITQSNTPAPQAPLTPPSSTPSLLSPVGTEFASPQSDLNFFDTEFCYSREMEYYAQGMTGQWKEQIELAYRIMDFDTKYRHTEAPGRGKMLLQLIGRDVNELTWAVLQHRDDSPSQDFAQLIRDQLKFQLIDNLSGGKKLNEAQLAIMRNKTINQILETGSAITAELQTIVDDAIERGIAPTEGFVESLLVNSKDGSSEAVTEEIDISPGENHPQSDSSLPITPSNIFDDAFNGIESTNNSQFMATNPQPSAYVVADPNFEGYGCLDPFGNTGFSGVQNLSTAGPQNPVVAYEDNGAYYNHQFPDLNADSNNNQPALPGMPIPALLQWAETHDGLVNFSLNFDHVGKVFQHDRAVPHAVPGCEVNGHQSAYPSPEAYSQVMPQSTGGLGKRTRDEEVEEEDRESAGRQNKRARYDEVAEAPRKIARARGPSKRT